MKAVIKAGCAISPQHTYAGPFPESLHDSVTDHLQCIEPDYRNLINPLLLRRMPRILKMGLAASQLCINRSGNVQPDGIIVGTGLGCLDNLEKFLMDVLDNQEHVLSVLPFINSTHNAVAAQVSMLLKNHNYNVTYCHRGFSFESALLDALMHINEKPAGNILIGGIDESTNDFRLLHSYLNDWKQPVSNLNLISEKGRGTIAGEGSAFFMLSGDPEFSGTVVEGVHTFVTGKTQNPKTIGDQITLFLESINMQPQHVEAVMFGINGDDEHDAPFFNLMKGLFSKQTILYYKHLCGEYYTSSAFALWLASVFPENGIPDSVVLRKSTPAAPKNMLIYNQIDNSEHSLIFLRYGHI